MATYPSLTDAQFSEQQRGLTSQVLNEGYDVYSEPRNIVGPLDGHADALALMQQGGQSMASSGVAAQGLYDQGLEAGQAGTAASQGYIDQGMSSANAGLGQAQGMTAGVGSAADYMGQFQNPYQQQVIDATTADMVREQQRQQMSTDAGAAASGAFGGSRHGVQAALGNELGLRAIGSTVADLRQRGFDTSLAAGQSEASRLMDQAGQYGDQSKAIGQLGLSAGEGSLAVGNAAAGAFGDAARGTIASGSQTALGQTTEGGALGDYYDMIRQQQQAESDDPYERMNAKLNMVQNRQIDLKTPVDQSGSDWKDFALYAGMKGLDLASGALF